MTRSLARVVVAAVLAAGPVSAHIKLTEPESLLVTNILGDPQKTEPCGGAGTASNVVTEVVAGSTLTVKWTETIGHPGHFRIGIAPDAGAFVTPAAVVTNNDCKSAPIETTPSFPTLVDGLFPHSTAVSGTMRTTTVTVPMMSCERCTLQLLQFMSSHAPPCFYYQCATLKIVLPDAGVPDAGAGTDAGVADAGAGGGSGGGAGGGGGGGAAGGGSAGGVDAGAGGGGVDPGAGGCSCAGVPGSVVLALAVLALRKRRAGG